MDSKGDGKHFFWLVFLACLSSPVVVFGLFGSVAHELHFCVCAGYRLLICYVSGPASQRGCWPQEMFYGIPKVTGSIFSGLCFWLATYVFFYGFEAAVSAPCGRVANASFLACPSSACSGVWPFRIRCQQFFGPSLAARVLATRNVLWIPKVTGSIFSGLCFWLA